MRLFFVLFFLSLLATLTSGCHSLWGDSEQENTVEKSVVKGESGKDSDLNAVEVQGSMAVPDTNIRELELRLSKLWIRVDELEDHILRQKEKIYILEKGLLTGLIPDELKSDQGLSTNNNSYKKKLLKTEKYSHIKENTYQHKVKKHDLTPEEHKEYQRKLAHAHGVFESQNYGQAIAAYGRIGEEYSEKITKKNHLYWMGVCWFYLKNFQLSQNHLSEFVKDNETSSLYPKAKLFLAKSEYQLGFVERSLQKLKSLIESYPNDDISKMAKWEIKQIEEKL